MNVLPCRSPRAADQVVRAARAIAGDELVGGGEGGDLARPCPKCGRHGDPEAVTDSTHDRRSGAESRLDGCALPVSSGDPSTTSQEAAPPGVPAASVPSTLRLPVRVQCAERG
jgi:hypothetical protein